ncbi:MAG: FeoB-associated Cys-rich membrane protein [Clostridiales bacterium]|nr:FeoB-associated Cys-rich membrane protein [Clostridiales bacterium]
MTSKIAENLGTILISSLLVLIVSGIILSMIRDKKNGRSSCGGNCAHCKMCTACKQGKRKPVTADRRRR